MRHRDNSAAMRHDNEHLAWLSEEESRLLAFARHAVDSDGYSPFLDADGKADRSEPRYTWVTGRMAYVHILAALRGHHGARLASEGLLHGLANVGRDARFGGWLERADAPNGEPKTCYAHAFVILAAASGVMAGVGSAADLLEDSLAVTEETFGESGTPLFADMASADRQTLNPYRGVNANMHMVEALLTAWRATGQVHLLERARGISEFVATRAADNDWRIVEHYDERWRPLPEYNRDNPADRFRPYGATVGHAFEWARIALQVASVISEPAPFRDAAASLYARAVVDGYQDGVHPGLVYTTDWKGRPVIAERLHWVVTEAISASDSLLAVTGDDRYRSDYHLWWSLAREHFIDLKRGSWIMQLNERNELTSSVWSGKPDLYHSINAVLLPQSELLTSSLTDALTRLR